MPKNFALRSDRKGKGLLPPNPNWWEHEHNALDVRHELGTSAEEAISHESAFALLNDVYVVPHTDLPTESRYANHFSGTNARNWSGMCVPCPGGGTLVVYNNNHLIQRIRATLMEEFFHLWLEHPPTRLRVYANGEAQRDYDGGKENEAYGSGAAALVPYKSLKAMLQQGASVEGIASHFNVSEQLVTFRMRITKLGRFLT